MKEMMDSKRSQDIPRPRPAFEQLDFNGFMFSVVVLKLQKSLCRVQPSFLTDRLEPTRSRVVDVAGVFALAQRMAAGVKGRCRA